jgi:AraC-like DNA-binding protein
MDCETGPREPRPWGESELAIRVLLNTETVVVRDIRCTGECRHKSAEECPELTHLVFPYRGVYVRHLGRDEAVAEANQVLFFNRREGYRISHPVAGGDACLSLSIATALLPQLAPRERVRPGHDLAFRQQRLRIDPRAQALVGLLRHSLLRDAAETLEAESLVLTLVRRSLGERTSHTARGSTGLHRLADRAKLILSSDPARRWTLTQIATEVGVSPVYLTQVFQQVEGVPLYRYQLRLRLARALDLLGEYQDLTALALDLGFSSHSHFGAAFRQAYGRTPAQFQRSAHVR